MKLTRLLGDYFLWHYTTAFADMLGVFHNVLWFLGNFFSFGELLRTFFSPFQRLQESYPKFIDFENFFSAVLVNLLMRLVGMVSRLFVMVLGAIVCICALVLEVVCLLLWAFAPLGILTCVLVGLAYL
jgi:hypothetical protein